MRLALFLPLCLLACTGTPVEGALPEGIYGSPDLVLTVDASGAAALARSCYAGDLGTPSAASGELHVDFEWLLIGGDPGPDSAEPYSSPATLDATATTTLISGTITAEGEVTDIELRFGEQPTYYECP